MSGTMKFTDSPEQAAVVQAPSYADVVVGGMDWPALDPAKPTR